MEEIAFAATPVTMLQYLHGASVDAAQHPSDTLKEDRDAGREQGDGKTATAKEAAMKADPGEVHPTVDQSTGSKFELTD
ncbi:hypothetical protein PSPO01_06536 [Paraphaeosphaeria sporulosa]